MSKSSKQVQGEFGQARASFAYLFKIEVDGELFLVGNEHPENWRYQPVGGGYHYFGKSRDIIAQYFADKAAPSVHDVANAWLKPAPLTQEALCSGEEGLDFRFLLPASKVRQLFEYFCSPETTSFKDSTLEQRMAESCELNKLFTDLVYQTGKLAMQKGWAQARGLQSAGQVMAYLNTQNNIDAGMPDFCCERELLSDLSREFKEELFDSGIIPRALQAPFATIEYDYLGYFREFFFDERFDCYSFFLADVVKLKLTAEQLEVFRWLKAQDNRNYCFIEESQVPEHILYRYDDVSLVAAPPIADHSQKILDKNLAHASFFNRTAERNFKVKLF